MSEQSLNQAIALIEAGKIIEARELLEALLETDRQNLTAWLWYVDTWPTDQQKIQALELCLQYNPHNSIIQQILDVVRSHRAVPPRPSFTSSTQPATFTAQPQIEATKQCPYCCETIQAKAIVCRYCGSDVAPEQLLADTPFQSSAEYKPTGLDRSLARYTKEGWQIVNRTQTGAQLKKPKQWCHGCLVFLVAVPLVGGFIFPILWQVAGIALVLAFVDYAIKKDEFIYLTET